MFIKFFLSYCFTLKKLRFLTVKNLDIAVRSSQNSNGDKTNYYCPTCDIKFSEAIELTAHCDGAQHSEVLSLKQRRTYWSFRDVPPNLKLDELKLCPK